MAKKTAKKKTPAAKAPAKKAAAAAGSQTAEEVAEGLRAALAKSDKTRVTITPSQMRTVTDAMGEVPAEILGTVRQCEAARAATHCVLPRTTAKILADAVLEGGAEE